MVEAEAMITLVVVGRIGHLIDQDTQGRIIEIEIVGEVIAARGDQSHQLITGKEERDLGQFHL